MMGDGWGMGWGMGGYGGIGGLLAVLHRYRYPGVPRSERMTHKSIAKGPSTLSA